MVICFSYQASWHNVLHGPQAGICYSMSQYSIIIAVVQSLSRVQLFATAWTAACQASPSFTISRSLLQLMSIEPVMSTNHLILCHPLFLLPSIFPSIKVFSNELALRIRWPKYWSFGQTDLVPRIELRRGEEMDNFFLPGFKLNPIWSKYTPDSEVLVQRG